MAFLSPNTLTFTATQIQSLAETFIETVFEKPELSSVHTFDNNIVTNKEIGIIGRLSKITKLDPGCGAGVLTKSVAISKKEWDPAQTKIWLQLCHTEFEANFMVFLKNKGINYADITNTDIADFILEIMGDAAVEDVWRIAWFNMLTPANLLTGVSVTDYNMIDGFWVQLYAIVAANSSRKTTTLTSINAQATFALQDSTLTGALANTVLSQIVTDADYRLQGAPDKVILCTQSIMNKYMDYLESISVPASFEKIEGGFSVMKRRGVDIIAVNQWDRTIRADFQNGTVYYLPHRALLTTKRNLRIGMDDSGAIGEFDVFFDKMTETNNFKGGYKIDAKIIEDYMVQVAY
jgi:hypothetical protein